MTNRKKMYEDQIGLSHRQLARNYVRSISQAGVNFHRANQLIASIGRNKRNTQTMSRQNKRDGRKKKSQAGQSADEENLPVNNCKHRFDKTSLRYLSSLLWPLR